MTTNNEYNRESGAVRVMKRSEFSETNKIGSLLFPSEYYDATYNCDLKKVRKAVPELAGQRIYKVLITTQKHPNFRYIVNEKITYKQAMLEGNHPFGDITILVCG